MTNLDIIMEKVKDVAVFVILLPLGFLLRVLQKPKGSTTDDNLDRMG